MSKTNIEEVMKECSKLAKETNWTKEDTERVIREYREMEVKANKYDSLVEKIKENLLKLQEEYELLLEHQSGQESNRTKYLRGKIHMCQELLDTEKPF